MKHLFIALLLLALPFSIQAKKSPEQDKTLLECKGVYDTYLVGEKNPFTQNAVEFRVNISHPSVSIDETTYSFSVSSAAIIEDFNSGIAALGPVFHGNSGTISIDRYSGEFSYKQEIAVVTKNTDKDHYVRYGYGSCTKRQLQF